jgi:molybdenum cofactor cytidylyltransferase
LTAPDLVAVVLAAGSATRFGGDKLRYPLRGKPLAAHIADTLAALDIAHRVAICPPASPDRMQLFIARGFDIVENDDPSRGMGSSLALAAQHAQQLDAHFLLVCLADMPNVTAAHLARLIAASEDNDVVATEANGVRTPPVIFASRHFAALAAFSGDKGARELLRNAAIVTATSDLVRDYDKPADFET